MKKILGLFIKPLLLILMILTSVYYNIISMFTKRHYIVIFGHPLFSVRRILLHNNNILVISKSSQLVSIGDIKEPIYPLTLSKSIFKLILEKDTSRD